MIKKEAKVLEKKIIFPVNQIQSNEKIWKIPFFGFFKNLEVN